jgi:hypothetical protein
MRIKRKKSDLCRLMVLCTALIILLSGTFTYAAKKDGKPRLYIKFKGIGTTATGGDYGNFVDRNETYFNDLGSSSGDYTIGVTTTPFFRGYGGEIGFETPTFAFGFSAGYIEKNFHLDYHYLDPVSSFEDNYTRDYRFSAIPLFLFIHYKLIDTSFLSAFVTIGQGVYLATYRDDLAQTFNNYDLQYVNSYIEGKKNFLGFHLGISLDFKISRNLAVFVEGAYRLVRFREIEAKDFYEDNTLTEPAVNEGELYYWTNNRTDEARLVIGDAGNRIFWDSLPAELDLNGFSLSVGIKITFGSGKTKKPVKIAPQD